MDAHTTAGIVQEVHHQKRDGVRLPFPCFQTNARFDGGMSGAPIFNDQGSVCGLVCSSLPPSIPDKDHASYVSTIWPMLLIPIDAPRDRYPAGTSYLLDEYAQEKMVSATGLTHFALNKSPQGDQLNCQYDRSAYGAE